MNMILLKISYMVDKCEINQKSLVIHIRFFLVKNIVIYMLDNTRFAASGVSKLKEFKNFLTSFQYTYVLIIDNPYELLLFVFFLSTSTICRSYRRKTRTVLLSSKLDDFENSKRHNLYLIPLT